jgi:hypothetical protein
MVDFREAEPADARDVAGLWVLAGTERARSFYQADGWPTDGMAKLIEIGGARLDQLRYRRRLGPSL